MLAEIGDAKNVGKAVEKAKDKNSGFRLMGFGHRVYKSFDPRATIIREMCHKVLADLNVNDPLLDVAMELEQAALKDSYFVERKLYPNVDFYSGIIYKALKLPTEMFTVMFAIARAAGRRSRTGSSSIWIRPPTSVVRARSTQTRPSATTSRSASADGIPTCEAGLMRAPPAWASDGAREVRPAGPVPRRARARCIGFSLMRSSGVLGAAGRRAGRSRRSHSRRR